MKYATAKEFMQNLPGVMYVNLDTATDRPYVKNYSEEIEIRNFIYLDSTVFTLISLAG